MLTSWRVVSVAIALFGALSASSAPILSITPSESSYRVGDLIVLQIHGDPNGVAAGTIFGRLVFESALATWVSSEQQFLSFFGGGFPWVGFALGGGEGFADAFNQVGGPVAVPDGTLTATVSLQAAQPGTLSLSWDDPLVFFGIAKPPDVVITIVPEPSTASLTALGIVGLCLSRRFATQQVASADPSTTRSN